MTQGPPAPSAPLTPEQRRHFYTLMLSYADRLIDGLNDCAESCPTCGLTHYTNRREFLERRSLKKIIGRLVMLREGKVEHES